MGRLNRTRSKWLCATARIPVPLFITRRTVALLLLDPVTLSFSARTGWAAVVRARSLDTHAFRILAAGCRAASWVTLAVEAVWAPSVLGTWSSRRTVAVRTKHSSRARAAGPTGRRRSTSRGDRQGTGSARCREVRWATHGPGSWSGTMLCRKTSRV